jgi:hypothetical protein
MKITTDAPSTEERRPVDFEEDDGLEIIGKHDPGAQLGAAGWGFFLIWLGIVFWADLGMGLALIGMGIITLVGQFARRLARLRLEGFWIGAGALFLAGGTWDLLNISIPLAPLLLVAAGLMLIVGVVSGTHPHRRHR